LAGERDPDRRLGDYASGFADGESDRATDESLRTE
jgi:hypothetical protein